MTILKHRPLSIIKQLSIQGAHGSFHGDKGASSTSHDILFVSLKESVILDEFMGSGHHLRYAEDVIDVSVSYAQLQVNKRNKTTPALHNPQVIQIHTGGINGNFSHRVKVHFQQQSLLYTYI